MNADAGLAVDVQVACDDADLPMHPIFREWARAALAADGRDVRAMLTVRLVNADEGEALNNTWRDRPGPTNVLAFPAGDVAMQLPAGERELGDLVVCVPVVRREAGEQGKAFNAHLAHMIVHGTLHLVGHDHLEPDQAERMEALERSAMANLGFADPYSSDE